MGTRIAIRSALASAALALASALLPGCIHYRYCMVPEVEPQGSSPQGRYRLATFRLSDETFQLHSANMSGGNGSNLEELRRGELESEIRRIAPGLLDGRGVPFQVVERRVDQTTEGWWTFVPYIGTLGILPAVMRTTQELEYEISFPGGGVPSAKVGMVLYVDSSGAVFTPIPAFCHNDLLEVPGRRTYHRFGTALCVLLPVVSSNEEPVVPENPSPARSLKLLPVDMVSACDRLTDAALAFAITRKLAELEASGAMSGVAARRDAQ